MSDNKSIPGTTIAFIDQLNAGQLIESDIAGIAMPRLSSNGTYFPRIKRVIFNSKTQKVEAQRDGDGKLVIDSATGKPKRIISQLTEPIYTTTVFFDDGTKSVVKKASSDVYNREHGVVYAIIKRLYGSIGENGLVNGDGLSTGLPKLIKSAWDQPAEEARAKKEKEAQREKNIAKQKAEHVAAKERKIKRLATEIEHWMEAIEYLKQNGTTVSPALVTEIMAASRRSCKCDDGEVKINYK